MSEPHELSVDECRHLLLARIWQMVDYWEKEDQAQTSQEKYESEAKYK